MAATDPRPGTPAVPRTASRLDDQLCFALYAATSAVVRAYRPQLSRMGLTYPQYVVLLALWEDDDVSLGDLSDRLGLSMGNATPLLDRLEDTGLIERNRRRPDRRVIRVTLTGAGRALEQEAAQAQNLVRCQTALDDASIARLREQLCELTTTLNQAAALD